MNPSKTANPTTGVIEAGPYSCLTRKNVSGITNLFKQTRYWILKPQTHTHHHNPQKEPCSLGASVSLSPPHTRTNPTELAFVLVRPGRNPVLRTMFPAGQRDTTLDQPNPATQLRTPLRPREPHHRTTARTERQLYSPPVTPARPPISRSRRVNDHMKVGPSLLLPFEHDPTLCCRAILGASLPCTDRRRRRRIRIHRPESARRAARLGLRDSHAPGANDASWDDPTRVAELIDGS